MLNFFFSTQKEKNFFPYCDEAISLIGSPFVVPSAGSREKSSFLGTDEMLRSIKLSPSRRQRPEDLLFTPFTPVYLRKKNNGFGFAVHEKEKIIAADGRERVRMRGKNRGNFAPKAINGIKK